MSKAIWVCSRYPLNENIKEKIHRCCTAITPDNIVPNDQIIHHDGHHAFGVMNPKESIKVIKDSLLLGFITDSSENWIKPMSAIPTGTFALFRADDDHCEIVSDAVASRNIWYFIDDMLFIVATSQLAICSFLQNFEFNSRVVPWILSTGTLGLEHSWDARIKRLPPDSTAVLKKQDWSLTLSSEEIRFEDSGETEVEHEQRLLTALTHSIQSIQGNQRNWILPISGGYDSRGILCLMNNSQRKVLKTITWGLKSALMKPKNDAYVAKKLTDKIGVEHHYLHTDLTSEPLEKLLTRFFINGEGQIDHIGGYLDGFDIWEKLHREGVNGIIRGDESFGRYKITSAKTLRNSVELNLCSDFQNLKVYSELLGEQKIPIRYQQRENESLEQWRDRLYQEHKHSVAMASLSDLKLAYVELINPLLFKNILVAIRKQPDNLRKNRTLFKKIIDNLSPNVAYATEEAIASRNQFFKEKEVVETVIKELDELTEKDIVPAELLIMLKNSISNQYSDARSNGLSVKSRFKSMLPRNVKNLIRDNAPAALSIDPHKLAFRVFMISRMLKLFKQHSMAQRSKTSSIFSNQ